MDSHLSDFPIEPARVVPVCGILPSYVARSVGMDGEGLTRALGAFGHERVGEVEIQPVPNPYAVVSGAVVPPDGMREPTSLAGPWMDAGGNARIVAMRFNGKRVRAWRVDIKVTQERLAELVRDAGKRLGEPNGCTKRSVQLWEAGKVRMPRSHIQRALESVTGMPFVALCTPVPSPNPDEATAELEAIVESFDELANRMFRYYRYLVR